MPIYEYACERCGTFEVTQRITDKPLRRCPTCKGRVTKLISSTSFQLKGSGWYVTDYAGKDAAANKGKEDAKSDSSSAPTSETKAAAADSKSDATKPASKKADSKKTEATAA